MKRICVYCGSSPGARPEYAEAARALGRTLARRGLELVYGGGYVGLMGTVARAIMEAGGRATGVIPKDLADKELAFKDLDELHVVADMHERKRLMVRLSDGFIAMPGGFGTLDEFFEVVTWTQLGFQRKPCGLLNVGGYFDQLVGYLDHVAAEGFIRPVDRDIVLVEDEPDALLDRLAAFVPDHGDKIAHAKHLTRDVRRDD